MQLQLDVLEMYSLGLSVKDLGQANLQGDLHGSSDPVQ